MNSSSLEINVLEHFKIIVLIFFFCMISLSFNPVRAEGQLNPRDILKEVRRSVVKIKSGTGDESVLGTGSVISEDGYILTVRHILEDKYGTFVENFSVLNHGQSASRRLGSVPFREQFIDFIEKL